MNEEQLLNELHKNDQNKAIQIQNINSNVGKLYSILVPYQLTYEVISGNSEEDFLNVTTFSEKGVSFYQESAKLHNYSFIHQAPHFHDYYELIIVLEGSITQYIEGNLYNYGAGSACFMNRSLLHKEQFHESAKLLFLGFSTEYLESLFSSVKNSGYTAETQILESDLYQLFMEDMQNTGEKFYLDFLPTISSSNPYHRIHELSEALMEAILRPSFGTSHLVDGLIGSILSFLCNPENYHTSRVEIARGGEFLLFMRIVRLLEESEGRFTRMDLAERLNYSGDYLNRIIKKHTGLSLHEYSMKFTMRKAAHFLTSTDYPVSHILHELSFTNRTYFYRAFENHYGMTPKEYRKLHRKIENLESSDY